MTAYADAVALFSGGRSTDSMYREAANRFEAVRRAVEEMMS